MNLKYCKLTVPNFGDDLNLLLWSEVFENFYEIENNVEAWGIGTLLDHAKPSHHKKIVLGTGSGGNSNGLPGTNWNFGWVRGPFSAKLLGLDESLGLGDAASLWSGVERINHISNGPTAIIPHWQTWLSYDWNEVAAQANMIAINPLQHPLSIANQIKKCSKILSESLHGGIFSDAIGVPWSPIVLAYRFDYFKWQDWHASINRSFNTFITDRALDCHISNQKAFTNKISIKLKLNEKNRETSLRPTRRASSEDVLAVADQLMGFASQQNKFTFSSNESNNLMKERMLHACANLNKDFGLKISSKYEL